MRGIMGKKICDLSFIKKDTSINVSARYIVKTDFVEKYKASIHVETFKWADYRPWGSTIANRNPTGIAN